MSAPLFRFAAMAGDTDGMYSYGKLLESGQVHVYELVGNWLKYLGVVKGHDEESKPQSLLIQLNLTVKPGQAFLSLTN